MEDEDEKHPSISYVLYMLISMWVQHITGFSRHLL